jgi:hypothetical protein
MADEILRRAARIIVDLRTVGKALNDAGHPGSAIRLYGFAGHLRGIESELMRAQTKANAEAAPGKRDGARDGIGAPRKASPCG